MKSSFDVYTHKFIVQKLLATVSAQFMWWFGFNVNELEKSSWFNRIVYFDSLYIETDGDEVLETIRGT